MAPPPDSPPPAIQMDESEYQGKAASISAELDVQEICLLSLDGTSEDTPERRAEIQDTIRSLKKQLKQLRVARQKQAPRQASTSASTNNGMAGTWGFGPGSDGVDPSNLILHDANHLARPSRGEKRSYSDHRGDDVFGLPEQSEWKSRKTTPNTGPGNNPDRVDGCADDGDSSSVIDLTREDEDSDVLDWKAQQRQAAETYRRNKEQEEADAQYARMLQESAYDDSPDFAAASTSQEQPTRPSGSNPFGHVPSQQHSKMPTPYSTNHDLPVRSPQPTYVPGPSRTGLFNPASAFRAPRMPGAWDSEEDDDDVMGPYPSARQLNNAFGPGIGAASASGYGAGDFARQAAAMRQRQLQYSHGGRTSSAPSLVPGASSSSAANSQLGSRPGTLVNGSPNPWANRPGMYNPNGISLSGRDSLSQVINRTNSYNWDDGTDDCGYPLPDHVMSYIDDYMSDPRKTDQQIKELLANISPDMDMTEEDREGTPEGLRYPLYKHQQIALKWMKAREVDEKTKGGLLADDMGLGKTISMLALILSRPAHKDGDSKNSKADVVKTNVIVGPVALIRQWEREIEKKIRSGHRLTVHNYHRKKATYRDLRKFDVVLNSYGKLGAELKELEKYTQDCGRSGTVPSQDHLMKICPFVGPRSMFYRVVLDEAQCIKNKNTQMAKACYRIQAEHRWCLSGTPMMNSVDELASLVHFLRIKPFDDFKEFAKTFNVLSGKRNNYANGRNRAMERLQILLKSFMLRRTKSSKIDGKPIIELPPKVEMTDHVVFNEDESLYYRDLEKTSQVTFSKFLQAGTVGKKYNQVLVLLLRLRQACCHPYLHITDLDYGSHEISTDDMVALAKQLDDAVVKRIKEQKPPFECPICYDPTNNPSIMLPCGHYTCGECLVRLLGQSAQQNLQAGEEGVGTQCPECRALVNLKKVVVYNVFQQVHMPETIEPAVEASTACGADADETDSDETDSDDSETASEGEGDDDVDENGDLKGFIVDDGDDGVDGSDTKDEEEDGSVFTPSDDVKEAGAIQSSKRKSRSAKAKAKLQRKGKGKQPKKADHKGKKKASAVTPEALGRLRKEASSNAQAHREYMKYLRKIWLSSAKVAKCKELIENIQKTGEKTIVFSQWTLLLDLLEIPVKHELKLSFRRYDGGMSASNRDMAVRDFMENPNVKVILVSLKAGNSGLNLTAASQVIIMDPFWNPYTEMQAVDRAHRIGQQKPVQVHRVLVKGTVEDRIMELQAKKRDLVDTALDEGVAKHLGRLNSNDLAYLFGIGSH